MGSRRDRQRRTTRWRPRWYELLRELVLAAGLTVFLVDEPDATTNAFTSGRAILLTAGGAVVWVVGRLVLARLVPWRLVRTAVFGLAALGALAVFVLPAYRDETVVEAFPMTSISAVATHQPATSVPSTTPTAELAPTRPTPSTPNTSSPTTTTTTPATEPGRLRSGPFAGIDHRASGTVSDFRRPNGTHVIGLEAIDIQPGPDYDVYIVPGIDRADRDGGTRLDDLRGNRGSQYQEMPPAVGVGTGDWTVLIWCQTFGVPVANATPD